MDRVNCVSTPAIVLRELSEKIINGLSREPKELACHLFQTGLLSQENVDEINQISATNTQNARKIYDEVFGRVQHFPYRYTDFKAVFEQNDILYSDLLQELNKKESEIDHTDDYQQTIANNSCDDLDPPPLKKQKWDKGSKETLNYVPTTPNVAHVQATNADTSDLKQKVKQLESTFNSLTRKAFKYLIKHDVDLNEFYGCVSSMDVSLKSVASYYLEDCYNEAKGSFARFWGKLNRFWNFFNYELFHHVVKVMLENSGLLEEVQDYAKKIEGFSASTKVCDFLNVWSFPVKEPQDSDKKKVTAKVNKKWEDCTLLDVKDYSQQLAQTFFSLCEFGFPSSSAGPGSLSIVWHVPIPLAKRIQKEMDEEKEAILLSHGFLFLSIENAQVHPLTPIKQCSLHLQRLYETKFSTTPKSYFKGAMMPFKLASIEKVEVWSSTDSYTMTTFRGDSDDVRFRKTPTTLQSFGITLDGSPARLILLEGAPGVGKTTFSRDACLKWARYELLSDTSILALFPLRDHNLKKAANLQDLLSFIDPQGQGSISLLENLKACKGQGMTFWFDGWDEIVSSLESNSIYKQIILGEILPESKVIVTSRSWATEYIKKQLETQPSQHIEIVSSIQDQINQLTELKKQPLPSNYISLIDLVLKNVHSSPPIRDNMHTPLATHITLAVYKWSQDSNSPLPTTVTQLYSSYTCLCIHKYLEDHPHFSPKLWKSNNFSKLPEPLYTWFRSMCRLAFDGLLDGQRLEFPDIPGHLRLETLGLMQVQPPLYDSEDSAVVSYHFNHLTLQEFLCALFLSMMTEEERSRVVEQHVNNGHFNMVMRFLSGLTNSFPVPREQMRKMIRSQDETQMLTVFHWLFEGGNKDSISDVIGDKQARIKSYFMWSPLDYFVAGHCITQSNCQWEIDFSGSYMGDEKFTQFFQAFNNEEHGSALITTIDLRNNELCHSLNHFKEIPLDFLTHLASLDMSWNKLDCVATGHLAKAIPHMPKLKVLNLRWNPTIQPGGVVSLALELCDSPSLKELNLTCTKIGVEDCKQLAQLLSSTKSLETLNVSGNAIPATGIRMLLKGLQLNNTIRTLDIHGNHVTVRAMKILSAFLQDSVNCKIKSLDLRYCDISPEIAAEFARGLGANQSLKLLRLSYNPIGDEGAVALGRAISINKTLTKISLVKCSIATSGGAALASSLLINSTMDKIYINTNSIGSSIKDFATVLEHNNTLKILDIRNDSSFSQDDVNFLLESLTDNQTLEELRVSNKYEVTSDKRVQWQ